MGLSFLKLLNVIVCELVYFVQTASLDTVNCLLYRSYYKIFYVHIQMQVKHNIKC